MAIFTICSFMRLSWKNGTKKYFLFLPDCLDGLAKKTGAVQRKRGVRSASDLLKMLFLYACSSSSFRILAAAAYTLGISDISDTAWRKHFSKSSSFLYEILASLLPSFFPEAGLPASGKNVLLVDASAICQNGKKQEQQADAILRITPKNFCLYDADGNKIPLINLLKEAEKKQEKMLYVFGFCKYREKTAFVRVIAGKLTEKQAEKARKRKKRQL